MTNNLYLFECDGHYEAGAIGVVASDEEHAVQLILDYSRTNAQEGKEYNFYIQPDNVLIHPVSDKERMDHTLWVLDREKTIPNVNYKVGVWLHTFHDG